MEPTTSCAGVPKGTVRVAPSGRTSVIVPAWPAAWSIIGR